MSNFPPLRLAVLSALVDLKNGLETDPDYLNLSPYDQETRDTITKLLAPKIVEKVVEREIIVDAKRGRGRPSKEVELSDDDKGKILTSIHSLIKALDELGTGEGLETNERIQIMKTKSALTKELLQMRERNTTAAKMEEFKAVVIGILEGLVDEKGREQFLKQIDPYR